MPFDRPGPGISDRTGDSDHFLFDSFFAMRGVSGGTGYWVLLILGALRVE